MLPLVVHSSENGSRCQGLLAVRSYSIQKCIDSWFSSFHCQSVQFHCWSNINCKKKINNTSYTITKYEENIKKILYLLFLTSLVFGGGCFNFVFSKAMAAAACWAFLIEGPEAIYSSTSPNLRQTVNVFLWAGPASSVKRYWCWILLYLASSFIKHIGVFSGMKK